MIFDALINIVFGLIDGLLSPLSLIEFNFNMSVLDGLFDVLRVVGYLLPMNELMPIAVFFVGLMGLRIAVALIKTLWQLLPLV